VKDAEEVKVVVRQVGGKATVKEAAAIVEPSGRPPSPQPTTSYALSADTTRLSGGLSKPGQRMSL
jgi:hypothetical protein